MRVRAVASGWSAACCSGDGGLVSARQREFSQRHRQPAVHRLLDSQLVVPWTEVVDEAMPGDHDPGAAVLLAATIGRSLAVSRPWSASTRLLAYRSLRCQPPAATPPAPAGRSGPGR